MYYKTIGDLPEEIKKNMSEKVQKKYLKIFNECYKSIESTSGRSHVNLTLEEQAKSCALAQMKKLKIIKDRL